MVPLLAQAHYAKRFTWVGIRLSAGLFAAGVPLDCDSTRAYANDAGHRLALSHLRQMEESNGLLKSHS